MSPAGQFILPQHATNLYLSITSLPGYLIVEKNEVKPGPKIDDNDFADLAKKHWGLLVIVIISVLVIALTPIVG